MRNTVVLCALLLAACGPQIGNLQKGETGRVVRAYSGDTLELDSGLRVFLAEIDAPRGEQQYAAQSQGELEALALHRDVLLAYGGERRWHSTPREGEAPREAAIAHVFVRSEGGRWFWLQHELVARGAAFVRPRRDNQARTDQLLGIEAQARAAERGLWGRRPYQTATVRAVARAALATHLHCMDRTAPYRLVEGRVHETRVKDNRAALDMEGAARTHPFAIVVFGDAFSTWNGPPLAALSGQTIRARGLIGVSQDEAQLCLEDGRALEVLAPRADLSRDRTNPRPAPSAPAPVSAPATSRE
jgi:endonuclease YncB( thermonuclease family)